MKRLFVSAIISSALALTLSLSVSAQDQCRKISCDCESLPSETWQKACSNQEARIVANCFKSKAQTYGYCSLHGPKANAVPLELTLANVTPVSKEEAVKLNNKVAVLYWSLYKGFDQFSKSIEENKADEASDQLKTFAHNLDNLFETQQLVSASLDKAGEKAHAQSTWRDYSSDTLTIATDIFIKAESVLNNYDALSNENEREKMRLLGLDLMNLSGKMYEQVGFAYAKGQRHKHAAQAWKNASKASALAMAHSSDSEAEKSHDFYRLQSAARLHRASFHWTLGLGRGSAKEVLAESQKFMDDNSELSSVVDEEAQISETKPYWSK